MVTFAITFNRFGNNKSGFGSKLTLIDHVSSVCHCGSVRLCARNQTYVTDIVVLTAVIWRLDTAFMYVLKCIFTGTFRISRQSQNDFSFNNTMNLKP